MSETKILSLPTSPLRAVVNSEPIGKGIIRVTERKEIEAVCVGRYFPRRLKRLHYFDAFSRDLYQFKKFYDVALIDTLSKALADVIRATGRTFDLCVHPPPSRSRLYYPTAHLAKAVAVELDLDLFDCLKWAGKTGSQKKRRGVLKLARLSEAVECTSDISGLRVLLADDILTTGLTASKCVEALKFAGAESVFCGILGWTVSEENIFVSKGLRKQCLKKIKLERVQGHRWEIQTHLNTENFPNEGI